MMEQTPQLPQLQDLRGRKTPKLRLNKKLRPPIFREVPFSHRNASNATVFEINLMKSSAVEPILSTAITSKVQLWFTSPKISNATGGTITITEKTDSKVSGKFRSYRNRKRNYKSLRNVHRYSGEIILKIFTL